MTFQYSSSTAALLVQTSRFSYKSSHNNMVVQRRQASTDSKTASKIENGLAASPPRSPKRESSVKQESSSSTPLWVYLVLLSFVVITVVSCPIPLQTPRGTIPTVQHVFFYGWVTAISTGLGVVPFFCLPKVASFWVGVSNAFAAGMMIAASYSLFAEGCTYNDPEDSSSIAPAVRTAVGAFLGLGFILATKKFLDEYEDLKVGVLGGTDARKALLIFFVMTLHSFSEGVGVGVSFGGLHGNELGLFISASMAVHNVPEGLAIAVVLLPRGVSVVSAMLWAISTSLPQPLMAVPAYLFVHYFIPILPVGLGFAGGAMAWVAFFELLMEAIDDTNLLTSVSIAIFSLLSMLLMQTLIDEGSRS